ncbi:PAS domain-containing protein [Fulvivirga lutimaris]|uniref:PAS domain-containing protein n=1 Tax=Fulvivirga lutimaris TaxID=1819566 RepID=UPI0012BD4078|nr:PAS domain-containing protein [Fulvivirga lutimaris]MTI39598.1 PAS domain S-box protein [Fulvivirga lutimaris]
MNINFVDAGGCSPEQIKVKVKKSNDQPSIIHNVDLADVEDIENHLRQIPQVKIHTQFSTSQPQPFDIFLVDVKHDFVFDGNNVSKRLKSKKKPQYDFKSIVEFSLNEVYIFNTTDYKFQFANQGALDNLGYTLKELKKLTPIDIKPQFTKKNFSLTVQPLAEGIKEKIIFKTIHKRADKSLYPVEVHLQIMEHDGVPFFVAVILDITEWENVLANSQDSTTKMELLAKNYPGGTISLIDKDLNIIYTDGEGYRQHNIDPYDLVGKPMKDTLEKSVFKSLKDAAHELKENSVSKYYVSFENKTYENTLKSIYGDDHHFKYYILRVHDITEHVKAREAILFERNRYASITKALEASALVSITDIKGTIIHVNEDFCKVSQYSEEELVGNSHSIINSGHHPKTFWTDMWKTVLKGKTWRAEVKNKAKDGSYYWVDTVINPVYNVEGKIETLLSIRYLITERKELELDKDSLTNKIRLATKAAELGIWTWDPATNEVTWDENNFRLYGVDKDSHDGTFDHYMKMIHPDDVQTVLNEGKKISNDATNINYGFRIIKPNGDIAYLKSMALKEKLNGKELIVGVNWDVTQEKEQENNLLQLTNKLSLAAKAAKLGIWTWDLKTGVVIWDDQMKALFGRKDFDNSIDTFGTYVHPDDVKELFEEVNNQLAKHKGFNYTFRIIKPNNKIAHIRAMSSLEKMDGKEVLIGVNWDITKEKEKENYLQEVSNKLKLATKVSETGIWSNNLKTGEIEWDDKTCAIFGTKKFPGYKKWVEFIHPDDKEKVLFLLNETIETNKNFDHTFRINVNGKIKYIKSMGTRARSKDSDVLIGVIWDVTKDKIAEQELKTKNETLAKLEKFINQSSDAIQVSDETGRLVYLNDTAAQRLGIDKGEAANYYVKDFEVSFKNDTDWKNHVKELKKQGTITIQSQNVNLDSKTQIPIEVTITYQKIGNVGYVIASSRDITERKKAEEELKESQQKYELALKGSKDGFWEFDVKSNELFFSKRYYDILGLQAKNGDSNPDYWDANVHPEYAKQNKEIVAQAINSNAKTYEIESKRLHADGHYVPVLIRAYISRDNNGDATRVTGTMMDLTKIKAIENQLRKSEEKFELALKGSNDGYFDADLTNNLTFYSDRYLEMYGFKDLDNIQSREFWHQFIHPDDKERVLKIIKDSLDNNLPNYEFELRMYNSDGDTVFTLIRALITRNQLGVATRVTGTVMDITKLRKAEKELTIIKDDYANLLNSVDGIIWKADPNTFEFSFISEKVEKITGYNSKEWLSKKDFWQNHIHPDDRAWAPNFCMTETKKNKDHIFEYKFIRKDGSTIWVRDLVTVVSENGIPTELIGLMIDITEVKQTQLALQESQQKLKIISENATDGLIIFEENHITYASKGYLNILGYTEEEALALTTEIIYDSIHPEDRDDLFNKVADAIEKNTNTLTYQFRQKHKKGHFIWREDTVNYVYEDGKLSKQIIVARDITERKAFEIALSESEEKHRFIVESSNEIICTHQPSGEYKYVSPAVFKIVGYKPEELIGKDPYSFIHPDDQERVLHELHQPVLKGNTANNVQYRVVKKDGAYIWLDTYMSSIKDDEGTIVSMISGSRDVTETVEAQLQLKESEERFRAIADNMPGVVYQCLNDEKFTMSYLNEEVESLTGYSREEFLANEINFVELYHADDKDKVFKEVEAALKKHEPYQLSYRLYNKKLKDYIWVEEFGQGVFEDQELRYLEGVILNIHESKLNSLALKESEEMLKNIANSIPGSIERRMRDKNGHLTMQYVSKGAEKLWELPVSDIYEDGDIIWSKVHPDDKKEAKNKSKKSNKLVVPWSHEYRAVMNDGRIKWISTINHPTKLDDGRVIWTGLDLDITDKKNVELNLAQSEEMLANIANSIPGLIMRYIILADGTDEIEFVSKGAEELWEIPHEEIMEDVNKVWSKIHPDDLAGFAKTVEESATKITPWSYEYRAVMDDGRIKWISGVGQPKKLDNGAMLWHSIALDVTDRKNAEIELSKTLHQLNLGIETGNLGIWERDVATDRLDWNEQMFEIFGVTKNKFKNHISDFADLVHPDDLPIAQAELGKMAHGEIVRDIRFRIIRPEGEIRHIYASGSPAFNDKGEVEKFIGINIDVTNVAEYQEQLEASIKEKDALFKELHHRIKNNLQMVSSLLFIKSTMTDDMTLRRFIDETSTKIHSISSIHEQLLQLQGVNMLDIKDYLESLCQNLVHTYSYGSLKFKLNMNIESAEMNIDRVLNIGLIVNEIISNSMKYAYPNSDTGEIMVVLKNTKNESSLTVSDHGIGIPSEKFAELDNSYGMQLISLFTKQIKGTLDIDNSKGTKYTIKFPTNV